MTVSIIIAVKACCENLGECVSKCLNSEFKDYEIIILPDSSFSKEGIFSAENIKMIPTGNVLTPPYKRDIGAKYAKGQILAFLDDDTYPHKYWLKKAVKIFQGNENIGCVCGPAVTAHRDSFLQKASGLVYSSRFISANHIFRYAPKKRREVSDYPSCNFLIRKDLFERIGGFDKPFWPGEDTFLCLKVLETGQKMIYDPKVLVFHHRRPLFKKHLDQIKNYAFHRGYFVKKYPKTSLRLEYFVSSVFLAWLLVTGTFALFSAFIRGIYFILLGIYLLSVAANSLFLSLKAKETLPRRIKLSAFIFSGIILTHLTYGFYFIKGLLVKKMPEE